MVISITQLNWCIADAFKFIRKASAMLVIIETIEISTKIIESMVISAEFWREFQEISKIWSPTPSHKTKTTKSTWDFSKSISNFQNRYQDLQLTKIWALNSFWRRRTSYLKFWIQFDQKILTERSKWYQISEIHVRFSKIQIRFPK